MSDAGEVTRLLAQASAGDLAARATLFDVLYRELRRLAEAAMRAERANHTLPRSSTKPFSAWPAITGAS